MIIRASRLWALVIAPALAACGAVSLDTPDPVAPSADAQTAEVPSSGVVCGPGTIERAGQCVRNDDGPPPGDAPDADAPPPDVVDASVPDADVPPPDVVDASVPDASGPAPLTCGPGTYELDHVCLPSPVDAGAQRYEIRTFASTVNADGYSKIPLVAFGSDAEGVPSTEAVVFGVTRPWAASLTPANTTLTVTGRTIQLTPCLASSGPACVGPIQVTMALASAPEVVVATSPVLQLTAPTGVGSAAACLVGGNVLYLDGEAQDSIHPGQETFTTGSFGFYLENLATFHLAFDGPGQSDWWYVDLSSRQLGTPLEETVYPNAVRYPFDGPGAPGLSIFGAGRGCNDLTGKFQVLERALDESGALTSFTATFEQHCGGRPAALRGCLHVEK